MARTGEDATDSLPALAVDALYQIVFVTATDGVIYANFAGQTLSFKFKCDVETGIQAIYVALDGTYSNIGITQGTWANGYYSFSGTATGNYAIAFTA